MEEDFGPDDHFNRMLVLDVMVKVFSYLSTEEKLMVLPRVCQNWAVVVQNDSGLWTTMEVTDDIPIDTCVAQLHKAPLSKKLKILMGIHQRCDDILAAVANHCSHLEELTLDGCTAEGKTIQAMFMSCTELRSCEVRAFDVTSRMKRYGLRSVFSPCPNWISPTCAQRIHGNCTSLKELIMEELMATTQWQIDLLTIIGPQLERLQISWLDEDDVGWLLAKCQQLQVLHIDDACEMCDESLLHGVGSLTNLRDLKLKGAVGLTPEALRHFLARKEVVGRLENLNLMWVTLSEACLRLIADNCPALRTLHILFNHALNLNFFRDFIYRWAMDPLRLVRIGHEDEDLLKDFMDVCRQKDGPPVVFHDTGICYDLENDCHMLVCGCNDDFR